MEGSQLVKLILSGVFQQACIFWRANSLRDGQLGGIGAIITLIGFFLQLLLPLVSLLSIPVQ